MEIHQQASQFTVPHSIFCTQVSLTTINLTLDGIASRNKEGNAEYLDNQLFIFTCLKK